MPRSYSRPFVTFKLATSLDGKIALANGQSEWITGEAARKQGRKLRAEHDAIAVGANTAVLDNPQLTARIDGEADPVRIIFDSHLRLSPDSNLARTAKEIAVWMFCRADICQEASLNAQRLKDLGVTLLPIAYDEGLDIATSLTLLKQRGIASLLLEGGGTLAASFIKAGAIDRIDWFRAPLILGGDGRSAIGALNLEDLNLAYHFNRVDIRELGPDVYERYERIG